MNKNNIILQKANGERLAVDSAENKPFALEDEIKYRTKRNKILNFIVRYNILRDSKSVENGIKGWRTALAHARKWQQDLFYNVRKVEILNLWTGEIISLAEAEKRAKIYAQSLKGAVIGTTT